MRRFSSRRRAIFTLSSTESERPSRWVPSRSVVSYRSRFIAASRSRSWGAKRKRGLSSCERPRRAPSVSKICQPSASAPPLEESRIAKLLIGVLAQRVLMPVILTAGRSASTPGALTDSGHPPVCDRCSTQKSSVEARAMTTKRLHFSLALFASMTAAAVASECGGNSSGPPPPTTTIQKSPTASGDAQADAVAATLPNPLQVLVTLSGTPQQGTTVTWATSATAASITPTSMTDASGIAMATWTLGHTAGTQTATATLSGATGSPVTFTATATPGAATQLLKSSGDNQTGFVTLTLANPLEVKVTDQFGNGVQGTGVDWQVTTGSASLNPSHATSDASGIAQTTVTLDAPPGAIVITATNGALTGSPITFHATSEALPTIAVGGTVTWTWIGNHSVQSTGSPSFMSSTIQMNGTHSVTFNSAGTYTYICSVHPTLMSGRVVVK